MRHRRTAALTVFTLGAIAACTEQPTVPTLSSAAGASPLLSVAGSGSSGTYVVSFKTDRIPADLSARVGALGGVVDAAYDGVGVAVVSGLTEASATSLASSSDVDQIAADEEFQLLDPNPIVEVEAASDVLPASASNPTTAFFYPRQWHMRQVRANVAWAAGKLGSAAVKVAILDTGIDYLYPDLIGRVDLANSASFVPSDDALVASRFPTRHVSTDLHYHGTHVAATVSSNSNVVAGVTSRTTLMAVKVLSAAGSGATSGILAGIVHAADHGAHVINMSLGNRNLPFSMKNKGNKDFFNKVVDRAFKYAHSKGVLVVVSAGNESQNLEVNQTFKPYCGAMHVICVSATGPTASGGVNGPWTNIDAFAAYSNYGLKKINVAAPGGTGAGFVWSACSRTSLVFPICGTGTFTLGASGTSMASPHTAGLAALLRAELGGRALGEIRSRIEDTADDLGAPGEDAQYGRGRINVARALGLQ